MTARTRLPALLPLACVLFLLAGPPPAQAQSPTVSQHSLRWYVHEDLVQDDGPRDLEFWEDLLTGATAEATAILEGASGPADTPCCTRLGTVTVETFGNVNPERDLYQIHTEDEWEDLQAVGGVGTRAFLVDSIFFCSSAGSALGCAQTTTDCSLFPENAGMDRVMAVSLEAWETWDRLSATIAHERGHNSCLPHSDEDAEADPDSCNLMLSANGGACLTASQCEAYIAAANGTSSATCDCHTTAGSAAPDAAACTTDEDNPGLCSGGMCGETGSDASTTLYASVGTAADSGDDTDEWISLSALTGHWTTSTPFGAGIEPTGFAYGDLRNLVYAVAPSGTNRNDLFSINPTSGVVTSIGTMTDFDEMVALAFDPGGSSSLDDDRLLALARRAGVSTESGPTICRSLVAIDPDDASTTYLGPINQACSATSAGLVGLAYDSAREKLYAASYFTRKLWEIDLDCPGGSCDATAILDCVFTDSCPDDFYPGRAYPGLAYSASSDRLYLLGTQSGPRTELDSFDADTLLKTETLNIDGFTLGGLAAGPNPAPVDTDGDGFLDAADNCPAVANASQLDTDEDSQGDECDSDDDGDGVDDINDAFPLDDEEDTDTDGDEIGNNRDDDDDNDSWEDEDELVCGTSPIDAGSVPTDTDSDGDCNSIDTDDDDDEWEDVDEASCGTNSLDAESVPVDTDGDDLCNIVDTDDDGDDWSDSIEAACGTDSLVADSEPVDTDSDEICNFLDTDDDGDSWNDEDEVSCDKDPLDDRSTPVDSDTDGICNFIEVDDDNDGSLDTEEITCGTDPLDAAFTPVDTDLDGTCNGADEDDDGDTWADLDEDLCGSDPLDTASVPDDFDEDLECDPIDTDDDNDSFPDADEVVCGSDPLDGTSLPDDLDEDSICDLVDTDDDGDGCSDEQEITAGTDPQDPAIFDCPEPSAQLLGGAMFLCLLALRRGRPSADSLR